MTVEELIAAYKQAADAEAQAVAAEHIAFSAAHKAAEATGVAHRDRQSHERALLAALRGA